MKKIFQFIFIICAFLSFTSCEKQLDSANVSTITYFPVLTMKGEQYMTILKGESFTDPGVTSKLGSVAGEVKVTGSVDPSKIGVYTITYLSTNAEGFNAKTQRYVGVVDPNVIANDFSGKYARSTNKDVAEWIKVSNGLYSCSNVGGFPTLRVLVYVFNLIDNTITVPLQESTNGPIECDGERFTDDTNLNYNWIVLNSSFGTSVRIFNKIIPTK